MSAADEAWEDIQPAWFGDSEEAFKVGYRRALEDAADAIEADDGFTEHPWMVGMKRAALIARAAAVAPRETKEPER